MIRLRNREKGCSFFFVQRRKSFSAEKGARGGELARATPLVVALPDAVGVEMGAVVFVLDHDVMNEPLLEELHYFKR